MDKDALQFYLESKCYLDAAAEEKLAQEKEQKLAEMFKQIEKSFEKKSQSKDNDNGITGTQVAKFVGGSKIPGLAATVAEVPVVVGANKSTGNAKDMFNTYSKHVGSEGVKFNDLGEGLVAQLSTNYNPASNTVNAASKTHPSLVAHELGHAQIHKSSPVLSKFMLGGRGLSNLATPIAAGIAASQDDPSYTPGLVAGAMSIPHLLDEAGASTLAAKALMKEHGALGGLKKSLPLLPAFASYGLMAAAPLGITALRKHLANRNVEQQKVAFSTESIKQTAINFAKKNPDIATHAITGGVLGGASELAMPSEIDAMGRPSTNMTQIGKRALLGATMGGIGSGVKQHVQSKIDKLAEDKIAKSWETVKTVVKNNPFTVGLGVSDALVGARARYIDKSKKDKQRSGLKRARDTVFGGLLGGAIGTLHGGILDSFGRPLSGAGIKKTTIKKTHSVPQKSIGPGTVEKGKIIEFPLNRKASASPIPKTDKSPKGTVIKFPEPEKLASALSPMLQRAGSLIAKNPRAASAALGAGTGLAANAVTGSDAPVFSAVAGGALGALGGKQLLRATVNRANPLLGKDVAQGAVGVMKQNRASQLALRPPKVVNMGATEAAASNLKGMSTPSPAGPRNVPVGNAAPAYSVKAQASNPASFTPTNQPKTSLTGVSFSPSATPAPIAQKADFMSAYRPTRSTVAPSMNQARAAMPQTSYSPETAQTLSKIAEIMKW